MSYFGVYRSFHSTASKYSPPGAPTSAAAVRKLNDPTAAARADGNATAVSALLASLAPSGVTRLPT